MRHRLCVLLAAAPTLLPAQQVAPTMEVYTIDRAHAILDFTVRLAGFNRVRGTFADWDAAVAYDPANPLDTRIAFSANVASIDTNIEERDEHLQGADFFDAARFERIRFMGRVVRASGPRMQVTGELTIRDQTRTITFPAEIIIPESIDPFGNRRLVAAATVAIDRRDFGVNGPRFWSLAISDSVQIEMELPGRIWNYDAVNFGRREAVHGPAVIAAAEAGTLAERAAGLRQQVVADTSTAARVQPFEFDVTVGRLVQRGRLEDALLAVDLLGAGVLSWWPTAWRARWEARRGEVLWRLGRRAEARGHLETAVRLDPTNTDVRAWHAVVTGP